MISFLFFKKKIDIMMSGSKFHHTYVNNLQILYFEAHCRIQGPIYGCAGIIFKLYEQINSAEIALAYIDIQTQTACHKLQAESNFDVLPAQSSITAKFQWKRPYFKDADWSR
ncbi:hypothetical protein GLYMA_08G147300v4 [Glycine max]|uniref:LOB domain-containing protein n=1 Tax=Glycine max TaxID=3847 RepID=K7L6R9_SOYBN|nr:hypothetical protein GYH30_021267 [Glycine max]KRH43398.1 hypothetical protein GLYMA_08G147300v4 [Glycine max]